MILEHYDSADNCDREFADLLLVMGLSIIMRLQLRVTKHLSNN